MINFRQKCYSWKKKLSSRILSAIKSGLDKSNEVSTVLQTEGPGRYVNEAVQHSIQNPITTAATVYSMKLPLPGTTEVTNLTVGRLEKGLKKRLRYGKYLNKASKAYKDNLSPTVSKVSNSTFQAIKHIPLLQ